jgi:hypothetical protein
MGASCIATQDCSMLVLTERREAPSAGDALEFTNASVFELEAAVTDSPALPDVVTVMGSRRRCWPQSAAVVEDCVTTAGQPRATSSESEPIRRQPSNTALAAPPVYMSITGTDPSRVNTLTTCESQIRVLGTWHCDAGAWP